MTLFVTVVLRNVMQVLTTDNNSTVHLGANNGTTENTATDGDHTGERTFLVNICALDSLSGSLETETNVLVPTLVDLAGLGEFGSGENVRLLLISALRLDSKLGRHCYLYSKALE